MQLVAGGPARIRVVFLLACVLALQNADTSAVGAAAPQLESTLHISNTQLGLLAAISTLVGALVTIPAGALADRARRVDLLAATVAMWALAMAASASAQSYDWLLLSRLGLGAVTAAAGPLVASLTGDYFAPAERGKIYGYILSGELLGAGFGFVVSGSVAGLLSWHGAFGVLALPAIALAFAIRTRLREPARGGASRFPPPGEESSRFPPPGKQASRFRPPGKQATGDRLTRRRDGRQDGSKNGRARETVRQAVADSGIDPVDDQVLQTSPDEMRLREAIRYVLSVKTNRCLISASVLGYFFFSGLITFALVFVRGHFSIGQSTATLALFGIGLGALAGVLIAGRLADRMIRAGRLDARVLVAAISYLVAALVLVPGLLASNVALAVPILVIGAAALAAPNPPLDAARLDIMPARMWGRAEGVRTLLRQLAQAAAPLLFGLLADQFAGGSGAALYSQHSVSPATTHGLQYTFLIMLAPLALSGALLFAGRRSYPTDIATAIASEPEPD